LKNGETKNIEIRPTHFSKRIVHLGRGITQLKAGSSIMTSDRTVPAFDCTHKRHFKCRF